MAPPIIPLSDGFATAGREAWLGLVSKTLKGAGVDSLTGRTLDGLPVAALYTAKDATPPPPFETAPRDGDRAWDIRAIVGDHDAGAANGQALEALAGGAASILLTVARGGRAGVDIRSADDMASVLDGVMTELAPVALDAGFLGPLAARWLGAAAKAAPTAPLAFHLDPLSAFAAQGVSPGPMDAHLEHAATTARELLDTYPRASLFLASGAVVHEAGGSPAWELAFAMAAALTYAKAMAGAGMAVEDAFSRIVLGLSIDAEPLASIAKLRAGRILWARVAGVCGAAPRAKIEARSSGRMLTRADRWTNLVRLTSAGFGGAVGGADAIVLGAFTDAIASPDPFALRMARNTQLILMDEAHLGKVADPAAGAWAMDTQTTQLARAAWDAFTTLEAAGGATRALDDGVVARAVETARQSLADALASREIRLIGVTDFVSAEPSPDQVDPSPGPPPSDLARQSGPDSHCSPLKAIRLEEMVA